MMNTMIYLKEENIDLMLATRRQTGVEPGFLNRQVIKKIFRLSSEKIQSQVINSLNKENFKNILNSN